MTHFCIFSLVCYDIDTNNNLSVIKIWDNPSTTLIFCIIFNILSTDKIYLTTWHLRKNASFLYLTMF